MDWWSLFFKIRKTIFAFIAIASLGWAITLSIYLAREWSHFTHLQRGLVLGIIGVNGITWLLLYLMIVVVFRPWLDFARVFFLLLMHIGGSLAVTLFSLHFSCVAFATEKICKEVDLGFIIGSWGLTGLLLGYMIVLLIMSRVPRPKPKITPNLLLDDPEKLRYSTAASLRTVDSATGLLRKDSTSSFGDTPYTPPTRTRSAQRTYRVTNGMPDTPATARMPPETSPSSAYGAIGTSARPAAPPLPPIQTSFSQARRKSSLYQQPPRPLPLSNPFKDSLPTNSSPNSAISSLTFSADQTVTYSTWTTGMGPSRYEPVPPLPSGINTSATVRTPMSYPGSAPEVADDRNLTDSPTSIYSLYDTKSLEYPSASIIPSQNAAQYGTPTPVWSAGASLRTHTSTPHSIHSVAPSMHLTHDLKPSMPPPAHMADGTDLVWRPYTADPHLHNDPPNHFGMASNADVRRLSMVPQAQYQRSGHGGTYVATRNAQHLAGAMGQMPPRSQTAVTDKEQWRQLVMKAATGRTL